MELDINAIEYELGEVLELEQLCSGVWYAFINIGSHIADEYYIVGADAKLITDDAKRLGKTIDGLPGLLFYSLGDVESGKFVVKYEVQRNLMKNKLPPIDSDSILSTAIYGTEYHPDYFGDYPAPLYTPAGITTRRRQLTKGVFAIETETSETMVAVCSPIWQGYLSDYTQSHGVRITNMEHDYMFFAQPADSLVLFELRQTYEEIANSKHINWYALMNAIWNHFPEYATSHNSREQLGLNDVSGLFFQSLGFDTELSGSEENLITLSINEGDIYLLF